MESKHLDKYLEAQQDDYSRALAEMRAGGKRGHWMWYIFPQIKGLGHSSTSVYYGIDDLQHAADYLQHPVLGRRLIEICEALLTVEGKSAHQIMGSPDDLKLRSSMTLFSQIQTAHPVFEQILEKYFDGKKDSRTLDLLNKH